MNKPAQLCSSTSLGQMIPRYKGIATINGEGEYGFMLTAIDGQISGNGGEDNFRFKIWEQATGAQVHDNQYGAADDADPSSLLGGGSIVILKVG